jgi:hypothetical protein
MRIPKILEKMTAEHGPTTSEALGMSQLSHLHMDHYVLAICGSNSSHVANRQEDSKFIIERGAEKSVADAAGGQSDWGG